MALPNSTFLHLSGSYECVRLGPVATKTLGGPYNSTVTVQLHNDRYSEAIPTLSDLGCVWFNSFPKLGRITIYCCIGHLGPAAVRYVSNAGSMQQITQMMWFSTHKHEGQTMQRRHLSIDALNDVDYPAEIGDVSEACQLGDLVEVERISTLSQKLGQALDESCTPQCSQTRTSVGWALDIYTRFPTRAMVLIMSTSCHEA